MTPMAADEAIPGPAPFQVQPGPNGTRVATNGAGRITLLDAVPDPWAVHARRGVRGAGTPQAQRVEWARVVLNGVSVYFDGTDVFVTRNPNLWP